MDRGLARQRALDQAVERVKAAMAMIVETHRLVGGKWEDACPRAIWVAERIEWRRKVLALREAATLVPALLHDVQPCHNLLGVWTGWRCSRCRRWTRSSQAQSAFAQATCLGCTWASVLAETRRQAWFVQGRPIMQHGDLLWCLRCGRYTNLSLVGLRFCCLGSPTHKSRLAKLRKGCRSLTGAFLGVPERAMGDAWWRSTARSRERSGHEALVIELGCISACEAAALDPFDDGLEYTVASGDGAEEG